MTIQTESVQQLTNLNIYEITILGKNGERYEIIPNDNVFSYVSMQLVEDLFETSVYGKLNIRDINSTSEKINFNGLEEIIIKAENPDVPDTYKSLKFKIYNVVTNNDQIENLRMKENSFIPNIILSVEFTSYEHYLLNYKEFSELAGFTGSDIISRIASNKTKNGLVNNIYERFFKTGKGNNDTTQKEMYIEPTKNWIWFKQNQLSYPWSKYNSPIKVSQLMNYLAENAVSNSNVYACNYLFWQDLDRWNFRSIDSLLNEPNSNRVYTIDSEPTKVGNIITLQVIQESNFMRLYQSNALSGKYYLVEPKWDHPYREYLDYNESHNMTEITYDYFRDYNKWAKVEKYPIVDEQITTKPTVVNVINDRMSGYFSPNYANREKTVEWEHYGYTFSNRENSNTWQPMFDQTDLNGEICRKIQKEIKQKIKDKKIEYAAKKNLKEKWKVYRCSICCDSNYYELEDPVYTQEYKIVAAGGFTDAVDFISGGFTLAEDQIPVFPNGLTLSYDFSKEPYSKTIGDLMYLRETPDIQTKYLYELELHRLDIAEEMVNKSIQRYENRKQKVLNTPICPPNTYNCGSEQDVFGDYVDSELVSNRCFCSEEQKQKFIFNYIQSNIDNRTELLQPVNGGSNYFEKMRQIIRTERDKFTETYEKYRNRKAFFISKDYGFTADNTPFNMVNIKSVKRIPIRGSKYEKLAKKSVLSPLIRGLSGDFKFKGFTAGITNYYPYEVFYDGDPTIDPVLKHPYYDSGYNFDVGYNASTAFSQFDEIGGPDSSSAAPFIPTYYTSYKLKTIVQTNVSNWTFEPYYDETPDCSNATNITDSSSNNYTENKTKSSKNYQELTENAIINFELQTKLNSLINNSNRPPENTTIEYNNNSFTITTTNSLPCNKVSTDSVTYTFFIEKFYTNNNGNEFLTNNPHICISEPFGAERLSDFNPNELINYLNSRNFLQLDSENPKKPIENVLEEIESFVRVEFKVPLGTNTLYDFPEGFYDKIGSEYFLPYHVMLTAGPFGAKSADYNISILGQDPFGFDVAVKRIRKKKPKLLPDKKALVNYKDFHINETGYNLHSSSFRNQFNNPTSYGNNGYIDIGNSEFIAKNELYYNNSFMLNHLSTYPTDSENIIKDNNNNYSISEKNNKLTEILYYDLIKRATRLNPLSLPESYFQFNNTRTESVSRLGTAYTNTSSPITENWYDESDKDPLSTFSYYYDDRASQLLLPGNVFGYFQINTPDPLPVDQSRFLSSVSYYPETERSVPWLSLFEVDIRNINDRYKPEEEQAFYGYYVGSAIWKHPAVSDELDLSDEQIRKIMWKNDISGESEYGLVGPELEEDDSTFDRNFAAQFVILSRAEISDPCSGYRCTNPNPPDNSRCPYSDPLCNCPCQELRPDKMVLPESRELLGMGLSGGYYGLTGPEPTNYELKELEKELKECDLIEQVLGEEWLGCVWNDLKSPLNCNCPCIGEKFQEYLKYSQTYCTFWETPPERPLLRNAQMNLIMANRISLALNGDLSLRPGTKVYLDFPTKRYGGTWLVSTISHEFGLRKHTMQVMLVRDSESISHSERSKVLDLNS